MAKREKGADERNQNRGLEEQADELRDPARRPPHHEQTTPSPRRGHAQEPPADAPEHLENPPQTEGPRERANDAV